MTVTVTIQTPTDKAARVQRPAGDGTTVTTDIPAGEVRTFYASDAEAITVSEIDPAEVETAREEAQTLDSGGGGHGDPDKPGGR